MRRWVAWVAGFGLTFLATFVALLFYSLAQPAMWMPAGFGCAFALLLLLAPRISTATRVGLSIVFGAGCCLLWLASASNARVEPHESWRTLLDAALVGLAVSGFLTLAFGARDTKANLWPAFALVMMGWLISYFSSAHGGASPMIAWVMRTFGWSHSTAEHVIVAIRKSIHVTFYGLVGATGLACSLRNGGAKKVAFAAGLLTALVFATFDELRQSTQADRGGSAWDVLLDMGGASAALVVVTALSKSKAAGRPKPQPK